MRGDEGVTSSEVLQLTRTDEVCGAPVYAISGTKLGFVESAAMDGSSGAVRFVVVSCRTFLGLRRASYLLPRTALVPRVSGDGFVMILAADPPLRPREAAPKPELTLTASEPFAVPDTSPDAPAEDPADGPGSPVAPPPARPLPLAPQRLDPARG